ncbi:MAG: mannose-1-phosphate guanylyltransferase [Acidobacteria bacterium]|uniref:Mannose-1-phosphate guanylyltransferase n=1 Tax=Candidatus Polarisedimenticola svalbardensis TaxID=2886004 RepID=A0A8J6XZU1_9BACT|nr:mannose-1-phosphate guanylyltransferase [Candidatus Polarisedimenticola svalbardensis]
MDRFHVVLLAGGSGTRFWPHSRQDNPKQFLALYGKDPLLVSTWKRARRLAPESRIWVVAPRALQARVRKLLPGLQRDNLVVEPSGRDTAPAIALACAAVEARDRTAVVGIFPTDHVIRDVPAFTAAVRRAAGAAEQGSLVCLGIRPDRPATGFGYLKCSTLPEKDGVASVAEFVEKPDSARARRFLKSGRYLWNGGMFVWKASRFLEELQSTAPRIRRAVERHLSGEKGAWERATRLSVDYAVMEQAADVKVVALDAGWDDLGSWDAAGRLRVRDPHARNRILLDSDNSVVFAGEKMVALVGVPDVMVVDSGDALLVVAREKTEQVKSVVDTLKKRKRKDLL